MANNRKGASTTVDADLLDEDGAERTSRREQKRQVLLDTAASLFAEKGYVETTVPEIVRAAGVGHGTFYEYFSSRRDILVAISKQAAEKHLQRPELRGRTLNELIRVQIYWYLFDFIEHLVLYKVWLDASKYDAEIAGMIRKARRTRAKQVAAALKTVELRPGLDPAVAATALNSMIEEFAYRWFVEGEGPGATAADVVAASESLTTMALGALGLDASEDAGA